MNVLRRPPGPDVARRLLVLQLGAERVPKRLSVAAAGAGDYWEPHLSFVVRLLESGDWVPRADAADVGQNLLDDVPCGSCTPDTPQARRAARASTDLLLDLGRTGARLVPGHDQVVASAVRHPAGGHR